jgi:hypothetical protein
MVARHPAGATWSSPVSVGPSADPVLAGNAAGGSVLAYEIGGDVDAIIDATGEPWSTAAVSTVSTGGAQTAPSVAIDGYGDAVVAWETPASGGLYSIDVAYRPAGGVWQPAITVDDDAVESVAPSIAFTAGGDATIAWATENGSDEAVVSATMTAGGSWTSPVQIATDTYFYAVQVALDASGEATAAWTGYDGTDSVLGAAERPAGGAWHADGNLAAGQLDGPSVGFGLAVNAAGTAALVWGVGISEPDAIAAAVRPAGGAWGSAGTLATATSPDFMEHPQIAVAADGTVTADWGLDADGGPSGAVWAAQRPPGATWNAPTTISSPTVHDYGGVTLVDPAGDVDILASLFGGSANPVWSMVNDTGAPALDGLTVPATGTVGVPVDFAVTPLDGWSAILSTHWSFGDGSTAIDESVSHVYTAPGAYSVTTSSSDILANTTSQSSTIVIAPAPKTTTGPPTPPNPTDSTPTPPNPTESTPTPRLTLRVTQTHRVWREATRSVAPRHVPVGTRFAVTVNQPARVTLTFTQALGGRRVHGRCRTLNATDRSDSRCTRSVPRGKLSLRIAAAGRHHLKFTGRVGAHRLQPGHYTVAIHASRTGGTATRQLRFTITS